jgi:hypothetical protein
MRQSRLTRLVPAAAALVLLVAAFGAAAETIPIDLEVGYKWVSVSGNEDMYRSQINEQQGFNLRSFTLSTTNFNGATNAFDQLRVDVSDLGAGPQGYGQLQIGKTGWYHLRLRYAHQEMFSALPAFANPFLDQGIIPGQQTWNRNRNIYDAELVLLPDKIVSPLFGYTQNHYAGPGTTTALVGGNVYQLNETLRVVDQEPRVGLLFNAYGITGHVTQGWRKTVENDVQTLVPGKGAGDYPNPVLGQTLKLTSYSNSSDTTVNQPITNAAVSAQFCPRCRVTGTYIHTGGNLDANDNENASGNMVNFALGSFYSGLSETQAPRAGNSFWRGAVRAEYGLGENVDFVAGWRQSHRDENGSALISTLFVNAVAFTGFDPNILVNTSIYNHMVRDDEVWDASVVIRKVGPVSIRGGYSYTKQDLTLSESLAEIVVPIGGQGGVYERNFHTVKAGLTFAMAGFTVLGDYSTSGANTAIVRTDFQDQQTFKIRGSWTLKNFLTVGGSGQWVDNSNSGVGLGLSSKYRFYSGNISITPWKPLTVGFQWGQIDNDTSIPILIPQTLATVTSIYAEKGNSYEVNLGLSLDVFMLTASAMRFENQGNAAFTIDRARVRGEIPFAKQFSIIGEWAYDKYNETINLYGDYKANTIGAYLRWHPN